MRPIPISGWAGDTGAFRLTGKFVMGFLTPFTRTIRHVRVRAAVGRSLGRTESHDLDAGVVCRQLPSSASKGPWVLRHEAIRPRDPPLLQRWRVNCRAARAG